MARIKPSIGDRLEGLRDLAQTDPVNAQDAAWGWMTRLGELARDDRPRAVEQLDRLFADGLPPATIDGPADGMVVATMFNPGTDVLLRKIGGVWMPWLGKRFHAASDCGENRITGGFRVATRTIWPTYATKPDGANRRGFEFTTRIERGAVEPAVSVLVIDYASMPSNPRRIVPRIRDELVQLVPGTYLGRMLWQRSNGEYLNVGFFALRGELA